MIIIPINVLGAANTVNVIATINSNESVGLIGIIGGIFFDENKQRLYVVDSSHSRILSYDSQFNYLSTLRPEGGLKHPIGFVRTKNGKFIVVESSKNSVLKIDIERRSVDLVDFSAVSNNKTGIFYPGSIAIDCDDNVYLVELSENKALLFDAAMKFKKEIFRERGAKINDIKIDKNRNIYTLSTVEGIVRKYNNSGKKILEFGKRGKGKDEFYFPVSLSIDQQGLIYVVDQHKNKIMVFDKNGKFLFDFSQLGWVDGSLSSPDFIFINNSNTIFVADRDNSRISIFR